jgi:hypothetical protein
MTRANMSWNIPLNSFSNHMNNKIRSTKMGPKGVFKEEKDELK